MEHKLTGSLHTCPSGLSDGSEKDDSMTHQTLATPTMALLKSASDLIPSVAYSMAWLLAMKACEKVDGVH